MPDQEDLYEVLQIHHSAQPEVIEVAYRRLLRMYHPDVNESSEAHDRMVRLNIAYEVLRDPAKRTDYDRQQGSQTHYDRRQQERQARAERERRERQAQAEQERRARGEGERREKEGRAESNNMTDHDFWQQVGRKDDGSGWAINILWVAILVVVFLLANGLGGFVLAILLTILIAFPTLVVGVMIYQRWQSKRLWSNIPRGRDDGPS